MTENKTENEIIIPVRIQHYIVGETWDIPDTTNTTNPEEKITLPLTNEPTTLSDPKIFVLTGLPGSGKSSYAETLSIAQNAKIHSSDTLRLQLLGNINDQSQNDLIFKTLHKNIKEDLSNGINCIYDASSITRKSRMQFLKEIKKIPCEKICIFMATPYTQCLENNKNRDKAIPEEVIKRMYLKFNPPGLYEGWDTIQIEYWKNSKDSKRVQNFILGNTPHDNKNHTYSIERHCYEASAYLSNLIKNETIPFKSLCLKQAAMLHDEGKIFTKSFKNLKGEDQEEAHYYNHSSVGSYNSFFYKIGSSNDTEAHLYIAQLISWHMAPYLGWKDSKKALERDKKLLKELYDDIMLLHEADVNAH